MFGREVFAVTRSPVEARKSETRQRILDAAREMIREKGIDKVSWRSIARAVNYSPAGLYEYFDNKDAIVAAIAEEGREILDTAMEEANRSQDVEARLIDMGRAYVRYAHEHPGYFQLVFSALPTGRRSLEQRASGAYALVRDAMRDGVDQGLFHAEGALHEEIMAYGFWGLAHGAASLQITSLKDFDADFQQADEEVFRMYLRGLHQ